MVVVRVIDGSFDFDLHVWTFRVTLQTDCPFDYENMNTHKILINMLAIFQNVSIEKINSPLYEEQSTVRQFSSNTFITK